MADRWEPFYIWGEVVKVWREATSASDPKEECRTRIRQAAGRIGLAAKGCVLTANSVLDFLERHQPEFGTNLLSLMDRRYVNGWYWQMETVSGPFGEVWRWKRVDDHDLTHDEDRFLSRILRRYDPRAGHEQQVAAANRRWELERERRQSA